MTGTNLICPTLTLVIPSIGRVGVLVTALEDLSRSAWDGVECLVVLQNRPTQEELGALVAAFSGVLRVFYSPFANASLARNIGLREAQGEIVLFLDDDIRVPSRDFLRNHARHYKNSDVPGVYGQVLEVGESPTDAGDPKVYETDWGWRYLKPNFSRSCWTRNGGSGNLSVRRACAIAVGGMDAWFERGALREETDFNLRLTKNFGPLVFDPDAQIIHLSASGGSRSWGHVRRVVPWHHIIGQWYFLFSAIRAGTMGVRGLGLELRYLATGLIYNPTRGKPSIYIIFNAVRALIGLVRALGRILRGPRRLGWIDRVNYETLLIAPQEVNSTL